MIAILGFEIKIPSKLFADCCEINNNYFFFEIFVQFAQVSRTFTFFFASFIVQVKVHLRIN
jgi:hypothetical protein